VLQKNWVYKEIDDNRVEMLMRDAGISRALAKVFASRGMLDGKLVAAFLKTEISGMHDPFRMNGMDAAVDRILQAIAGNEEILIYGDYDVDGVAGTSILYNFLKSREARVQYFIPDRMEDGYGLTMSSAEKVKELKAGLLITVDCGISSVDEVKSLTDAGMQVIVTDHHECREVLPDAVAVLNPHKPGCGYPFKELCGAGVALKVVQAIGIRSVGEGEGEFRRYLDLAALATIADMVPLQGENRIIASLGLKLMEKPDNLGLSALIKVAGLGEKEISSYGVAFGLAPRVNAAGRLGSAARSVRLFTTDSLVLAEALAKELDAENKSRQETETGILNEAVSFVEEKLDPAREKVLVVSGEGWHHGVIGIVASKVLEKYNRPCIVISIEDGVGKGSGRSIAGLNLFKALSGCEDLLDRFGGHEMAAGLTIQADRIGELRKRLNEYADTVLTPVDLMPCVRIDAFLDCADLAPENARELSRLAPFGLGNPGPVFGFTAFVIREIKTLSSGKHLKLRLVATEQSTAGQGGQRTVNGIQAWQSCNTEAIGFNMGELSQSYEAGDAVDAVFTMEINSWNGSERLQLNLKDIKTCIFVALDKNIVFSKANDYNKYINRLLEFCGLQGYCLQRPAGLVPERHELEAIFRYIRACGKAVRNGADEKRQAGMAGMVETAGTAAQQKPGAGRWLEFADLFEISNSISQKYNVDINYFKLKKGFEIFAELGLLTMEPAGRKGVSILLSEGIGKVNLEASAIYSELQCLKDTMGV
jgi:single-stranded-DNA-specific exonuclease